MKVSVVGSNSFLAKHIIEQDSSIDWNLLGNDEYYFPEKPLDMHKLRDSDIILFTAGAGIQPRHNHSNDLIFELNCFEVVRLVNLLNEKDYKGRLITFGSYFELGVGDYNEAVDETELVSHHNPYPNSYCESKNLLSRFIHQRIKTGNSFQHQHHVLTNIFGFGEHPKRLIPYILQQVESGDSINFTSGTQHRQYTDIHDLSIFIVEQAFQQSVEGIFNLTSQEVTTVRAIVENTLRVIKESGRSIPHYQFGVEHRRDSGMTYLALDASKTLKRFGTLPNTDIIRSLEQYVSQYFCE